MDAAALIEQTFRAEHGRVLGALIRSLGDFDLAEDVLQETLVAALERWPVEGAPRNPAGWIVTVARRKAIDRLRRDQAFARRHGQLADQAAPVPANPADLDDRALEAAIPDERLALIFTCCHPALAPEAQIALILRALGGLSTAEIARAFLTPVPTMNQRLTRAKHKIRSAGIPFQAPATPQARQARLGVVLHVLYLIFNEGYAATTGDDLLRPDLCAEAIALARVLAGLLSETSGDEPEAVGLLALMLLHHSRRAARTDAAGGLVLLEDQDRTLWDPALIAEGTALLDRALALRRPGPYQLQAAISALHAQARTAAETDWKQIAALYAELEKLSPTPVVALNHAVALGQARGPLAGLMALDQLQLDGPLGDYHWYHAARADLLRRAGYQAEARAAYGRALALCRNGAERAFLSARIRELGGEP